MKIKLAIITACTLTLLLIYFNTGDALLKQLFFSLSFVGFLFGYRLTLISEKKKSSKTASLKKYEEDPEQHRSMVA